MITKTTNLIKNFVGKVLLYNQLIEKHNELLNFSVDKLREGIVWKDAKGDVEESKHLKTENRIITKYLNARTKLEKIDKTISETVQEINNIESELKKQHLDKIKKLYPELTLKEKENIKSIESRIQVKRAEDWFYSLYAETEDRGRLAYRVLVADELLSQILIEFDMQECNHRQKKLYKGQEFDKSTTLDFAK